MILLHAHSNLSSHPEATKLLRPLSLNVTSHPHAASQKALWFGALDSKVLPKKKEPPHFLLHLDGNKIKKEMTNLHLPKKRNIPQLSFILTIILSFFSCTGPIFGSFQAQNHGHNTLTDRTTPMPSLGYISPAYFDISIPRNVTALVGKSAYLSCRVRNLGNKTVSFILIFSPNITINIIFSLRGS